MDEFNFDDQFEQKLLAFLVRDIKFFIKNANFMQKEYFDNQIYRDIFFVAKPYLEKYNEPLPLDVARNEITKLFRDTKKKDIDIDTYFDFLDNLYKIDISFSLQYTEDMLLRFAQNQEMKRVLIDGAKRVEGFKDLSPILVNVTKTLVIGNKLKLGYDYFDDTITRTGKGYDPPENVVNTGFRRLNRFLGGGLAGGELGVLVAPSSRGKTAGLVNIAVGALMSRKNVIYICLEGKIEDVATRFDMRISRTSKDFLNKEWDKVRDNVIYFSKRSKSKIIIQSFPTEFATVSDIDQYISHEEIVRDFEANLIIIDYLNLCKRSNPKEDTWLGTNYREGKSLAVRRNKPLWSAAQAKEGSLRAEIVEPRHIAEATIRIWSDSDVVIGLCQSEEEENKEPMELRWFLGKNRNREAKKNIPMIFDKYKMLMEEVPV